MMGLEFNILGALGQGYMQGQEIKMQRDRQALIDQQAKEQFDWEKANQEYLRKQQGWQEAEYAHTMEQQANEQARRAKVERPPTGGELKIIAGILAGTIDPATVDVSLYTPEWMQRWGHLISWPKDPSLATVGGQAGGTTPSTPSTPPPGTSQQMPSSTNAGGAGVTGGWGQQIMKGIQTVAKIPSLLTQRGPQEQALRGIYRKLTTTTDKDLALKNPLNGAALRHVDMGDKFLTLLPGQTITPEERAMIGILTQNLWESEGKKANPGKQAPAATESVNHAWQSVGQLTQALAWAEQLETAGRDDDAQALIAPLMWDVINLYLPELRKDPVANAGAIRYYDDKVGRYNAHLLPGSPWPKGMTAAAHE